MMQTVQLSVADSVYATAVREALSRSCACRVEFADCPDLSQHCVLVVDELALARLPRPLSNPERIVLITRKNPTLLAQAWEAGIVSVVTEEDSMDTVLLAIMAAALRVAKSYNPADSSGISPNRRQNSASLPPLNQTLGSRRCKTP
jgi:hypothetical protein